MGQIQAAMSAVSVKMITSHTGATKITMSVRVLFHDFLAILKRCQYQIHTKTVLMRVIMIAHHPSSFKNSMFSSLSSSLLHKCEVFAKKRTPQSWTIKVLEKSFFRGYSCGRFLLAISLITRCVTLPRKKMNKRDPRPPMIYRSVIFSLVCRVLL